MKAEETPCPLCGEMSLRIEMKLYAKPLGTFSLAGQQPKVSAYEWPHLICEGCGMDAPATPTLEQKAQGMEPPQL